MLLAEACLPSTHTTYRPDNIALAQSVTCQDAELCVSVLGRERPLARPIYKICAMCFSARREPISRSLPYSQVYQRPGMGPESSFLFLGASPATPSEFLELQGGSAGWSPQMLSHQQAFLGPSSEMAKTLYQDECSKNQCQLTAVDSDLKVSPEEVLEGWRIAWESGPDTW